MAGGSVPQVDRYACSRRRCDHAERWRRDGSAIRLPAAGWTGSALEVKKGGRTLSTERVLNHFESGAMASFTLFERTDGRVDAPVRRRGCSAD